MYYNTVILFNVHFICLRTYLDYFYAPTYLFKNKYKNSNNKLIEIILLALIIFDKNDST